MKANISATGTLNDLFFLFFLLEDTGYQLPQYF